MGVRPNSLWTPFFAWYPIETESGWCWLRWVERRHTGPLGENSIPACLADFDGYWIYREPSSP